MRKIAANYLFTGTGKIIKNGIVIFNSDGIVASVVDPGETFTEISGLEFYNGILTPGFINTHCHLELSHLKGIIPEHTGLPEFIQRIISSRSNDNNLIQKSVLEAHNEMVRNGIVAVGDIANTGYGLAVKPDKNIAYHTFIEVFGSDSSLAEEKIRMALEMSEIISKNHPHSHSIVPHAPYSVSPGLLKYILKNNEKGLLSFHNQESAAENELFETNSGSLLHFLQSATRTGKYEKPNGLNSTHSIVSRIKKGQKILLVHNTFTRSHDLELMKAWESEIYWVLCPGANLYIEEKLPDLPLFIKEKCNLVIGTDSLASNHHLSILEELKILNHAFPDIPLTDLLTWGTLNGATALNMDETLGSFAPGKKPGLNLIHDADLEKMKLTDDSWVEKII